MLFLLTLFFAPMATAIPAFATAPALVFVACLMARALRDIGWDDATEYMPAVMVAIGIPFTFSIATGIGLGFIVYAVVKAAAGRIGAGSRRGVADRWIVGAEVRAAGIAPSHALPDLWRRTQRH